MLIQKYLCIQQKQYLNQRTNIIIQGLSKSSNNLINIPGFDIPSWSKISLWLRIYYNNFSIT